jgi:acetyltransferase-like isoleucine patch superfamily enzyme
MMTSNAQVDPAARVHSTVTIWDQAQVREHAVVGTECIIGRGAYIGAGVQVGNRVKVQNYALLYEPAVIEDDVFIGPAVVLTNDRTPRAVTPDGRLATAADWDPVGVTIREGASIGARAVCVAPVTVGRWAMVGAGSVVTRDVPDFALVLGVPAKQAGWVGRAGHRLEVRGDRWICPSTGAHYALVDGVMTEATDE